MSKQIFDVVQVEKPNRNAFDLTHDYKTSMKMANLVPACCIECIPGDRITLGSEALIRFAPLIAPVMQRFDCRIEYFFVPNRLLWDNWQPFIASDPGNVNSIPAMPYINIGDDPFPILADYFGIPKRPVGNNLTEGINALPFAAYQLIYDQYYRDQNLIPSVFQKLVNGNNVTNYSWLTEIKSRAWEHDYFTSCLPFAQKGNPVTIGTGGFNNVGVQLKSAWDQVSVPPYYETGAGATPTGNVTQVAGGQIGLDIGGNPGVAYNPQDTLEAQTNQLNALNITINDLREAEALQKWLEINARAGTRPNEVIEGHFGVKSSDARLQRPEYIVGVKMPVSVSEVLNTTGTDDLPQGNMAGHGVSMIDDQNYGSYFCEEHGFIIGLVSVVPKTSYQQGLEKFWIKTKDSTQYFFPSFAHIGEQPVENREIYAYQGAASEQTFGYNPAYQDYRFKSNIITGQFRDTLSYWHCGRIFPAPPALNGDFITCQPRTDIFAVSGTNDDYLFVHVMNKIFASRLIPVYGTPTL